MVSTSESDYIIQNSEIQELSKIDEGSFGVVYKGLMQGYIEVAIKKLFNQNISEQAKDDLKQEIAITQKIRHPNVITVYGYCSSPLQLIMEYLPQNLFNLLHNKKELAWELRYKISLDIVQGLQHIHKKNIIHRDLKSNNIMIDTLGKAKITDFGLSRVRIESKSLQTQQKVGNIRWMAPELMDMKPKYGKQSDIFALGVIFWEIATQEVPFPDTEDRYVEKGIKKGRREEIPEDCPQEYSLLIQGCWKQTAQERLNLEVIQAQLLSLIKQIQSIQQITSIPEKVQQIEENKTKFTEQQIYQIAYNQAQDQTLTGHESGVVAIAVSNDTKWIVSGSNDGTIRVWDFWTGSCTRTLTGHEDTVVAMVVSNDTNWIVSGSNNGTIHVWDFWTGSCTRTLKGNESVIGSIAVSNDTKWIVSGSYDGTIRVWDFWTGSCTRTLTGHWS